MSSVSSTTTSSSAKITTQLLQTKHELSSDLPHNFGIMNFTAPTTTLTQEKLHLVFTIDRSGSMLESIDNLKHCVRNMFNYLHERASASNNMFLSVILFDNRIEYLLKHHQLTNSPQNKEFVDSQIEKITARGMTNIEAAFQAVESLYKSNMKNIHIFMTDGNPTCGASTNAALFKHLSPNFEHNLIGFGCDHNEQLLNNLTIKSNGNYYFIDNIENAGMVYGEVLDKVLYRVYEDVVISSENMEFYKPLTNEWSNVRIISYIGSDETQTVHFRFNWQNENMQIHITAEKAPEYLANPVHETHELNIEYDACTSTTKDTQSIDVAKYLLRQKTLELMYEATHPNSTPNTHHDSPTLSSVTSTTSPTTSPTTSATTSPTSPTTSPSQIASPQFSHLLSRPTTPILSVPALSRSYTPSPVMHTPPRPQHYLMNYQVEAIKNQAFKTKLTMLFDKIKAFMAANDLNEDPMLMQLLDDIQVQYKVIENPRLTAYGLARHTSQSAQRAYNVRLNAPRMPTPNTPYSAARLFPSSYYNGPPPQATSTPVDTYTDILLGDHASSSAQQQSQQPPFHTSPLMRTPSAIETHQQSQNILSVFATPHRSLIMREVSNH